MQARRSAYDPDELDDEQRERQMRKRLNVNFREFCGMVEKVKPILICAYVY
jgi:nucleosome binding factor SPN SPT16 subunit